MTTIHIVCGLKQRPKPRAGDEKTLANGTIMIRQQVHTGRGWQVSNGRPVYEWVVKGSEDDRRAQGSIL